MADYWQDKRINQKHVACAWALVVVVLAVMVVISSLAAPGCMPGQDVEAGGCGDGKFVPRATSDRQTSKPGSPAT
jgi:hypothetical protein